ncbi:uncharacterized protein K441DRAFT_532123 [Cenococcum geophilum 1.58]|uniref:uncharacterized protein n=1 Tax=Cenococcum geophilum 1.58 TaxID=794803 RepID=UPI00358DFE80|nr:hypothetical protein K441DRAFT_532123 [Cenococcum geophilum 1.58]
MESTESNCVLDDALELERVAVGPYCVFDDFKPLPLSPRLDHQTPTEASADKENMNDSTLSTEYPFDMSLATASPNNFGPSGNWEEWMKWDPSPQNQSPKTLNAQSPLCYLKQGQQRSPIFDRRQNSQLRNASLELTPRAVPTSKPMPMRVNSTPFTFGETADHTPAFHFDSGVLSSPLVVEAAPNNGYFNTSPVLDQPHPVEQNDNTILSPLGYERPQLRAITMPPHSTPSLQHSPSSATDMHTSSSSQSSPEPAHSRNNKKRKSASEEDLTDQKAIKQPPVKKTAHNMIEKRYRTNLNDRIAALRDSVPSLRVTSRGNGNGDEEDDPEDLEGLTPAHKLNKATVLSKATEYIRHLERRNKHLCDEVAMLKSRMDAFEKLSMSGPMAMTGAVTTPDGIHFQDDPFGATDLQVSGPPQGLIPVPESMANLHRGMSNQPHYAPQSTGYPMYSTGPGRPGIPGQPVVNGRRNNALMGKLMVGSLAGIMIMEGLSEREQSGEQPAGRGLFALPFNIANILAPRVSFGGMSAHVTLLPFLKLFLVLGAIFYITAPLFEFKPKKEKKKKKKFSAITLSPAPSLASPVEVRRKAWLTAIQTVWVPRHSFLLEVAALGLKTLKLSTRKIIGWPGYALLTGITKEQETARIRAWEIALDAQLTGGDAEISMSRLVLTLMASGTLPDTPARLMLKALHIRVLLWEVANAGYGAWYMFEELSAKLARSYWNAAQHEHKIMCHCRSKDTEAEPLPDHLAALLDMRSDEVLVDVIIQRAYNLAWNKPSAERTTVDESMDSVVEDFSISSPLDALAAWWSGFVLNRALVRYLASDCPTVEDVVKHDLALATLTAPPMSCAQVRAFVANAVLLDEDRSSHIDAAFTRLPSSPSLSTVGDVVSPPRALLMNIVGDAPTTADVKKALTLAKCLFLVEEQNTTKNVESRPRATFVVNNSYFPEASITLLSLVAALKVLDVFLRDDNLLTESKHGLERMVHSMRVWVGLETGRRSGLQSKTQCKIIERCLNASKMLVGMSGKDEEIDAGYVSQSDTDS